MIGAGLLARNALQRGLTRKPWVKTSLAPGSTVVTDYLRQGGADEPSRPPPVQPGRLRMHHLHRQLRAAGRGDLGRDRRKGPGGLRGPLRQPQLRGPDQPGREGQLPGQPAAGRRLRAGRADGPRPRHRAARRGLRRRAGLPARHLAQLTRRSSSVVGESVAAEMFKRNYADVFTGDEELECGRGSRGRPLHLARLDLRAPPSFFEDDAGGPARRLSRSRARGSSPCSATRSPPTTSRPPGRSKKTARPGAG